MNLLLSHSISATSTRRLIASFEAWHGEASVVVSVSRLLSVAAAWAGPESQLCSAVAVLKGPEPEQYEASVKLVRAAISATQTQPYSLLFLKRRVSPISPFSPSLKAISHLRSRSSWRRTRKLFISWRDRVERVSAAESLRASRGELLILAAG